MSRKGPQNYGRIHTLLRWVAGTVASGVLMHMMLLSIEQDVRLHTEYILGMLALIVILLYGPEALANIIESWRGE